MASASPIPITVFTGFLGSGKTSIILSLLPKLPKDYKVVLLKNEFGDIEVDSQLAKQSSLTAVSEILNGCMCCVLVGQMKTAILEIRDKYRPDRIIIETSGSAFPATLAFQIREIERETSGDVKLDAIVTVIDAENFTGYEDTSTTAKMQAQYTDVLLINKSELVSERQLDLVLDHLYTLNESTPKIKCIGRTGVDPALIFGLDTKLFPLDDLVTSHPHSKQDHHEHDSHDSHESHAGEQHDEVETATIVRPSSSLPLTIAQLEDTLFKLPRESVYRVKGFVTLLVEPLVRAHPTEEAPMTPSVQPKAREYILNWAFGRFELTEIMEDVGDKTRSVGLTMMGERGEIKRKWAMRFADAVGATVS